MQEKSQLPNVPPLSGPSLVAGINEIARTLGTNFAGADDPAALAWPYATWADTGNGLLKRRNAADTAWVVEAELFEQAARRNGDSTQNFEVASLNGGQLAGFRNKIINGAFQVNQRFYVSGAATTAGQYTLDRWKVTGAGGISFSTVNNKTTVTIPAGQTLQQVIAGINLDSGTYILSWEGSAQGRVGSGAYGNSGQVTANITGGVNTTIEFNAGTVANVMFEPGVIATPFEWRGGPLEELNRCHPYYWNSPQSYSMQFACPGSGGFSHIFTIKYPRRMRVTPTLSTNFQGAYNAATPSVVTTGTEAFQVQLVGNIQGNSGVTLQDVTSTAEL